MQVLLIDLSFLPADDWGPIRLLRKWWNAHPAKGALLGRTRSDFTECMAIPLAMDIHTLSSTCCTNIPDGAERMKWVVATLGPSPAE